MGNPYVGIEVAHRTRPLHGEVGIRLPLDGGEEALLSGMASDLDRREAFFGDEFSIVGLADYRYHLPGAASGWSLRLRGGPNLWIYADDVAADDADLFANYAAQVWYDARRIQLGIGAVGRALLTEDNLSFGARTAHQLDVSILGTYRTFQPGLHFGLPFDDKDFNEMTDYVVGVSLTATVG